MTLSSSFGTGVAAALGAPLIMTIGFILWQNHWKGSAFSLNLFKCCLASLGFLVLSLTVGFARGERPDDEALFPPRVFTRENVGFLVLSSTIGIVIGDWTWLQALQMIGAKRVILMDSSKPFLASFFGYVLLNEQLRPEALAGVVLTVAGILVVSLEQTTDDGKEEEDSSSSGHVSGDGSSMESVTRSFSDSKEMNASADEKSDNDAEANMASTAASSKDPKREDHNTQSAKSIDRRKVHIGFLLSAVNLVLDTYGSVLTKEYGLDMTVWEVNLIRFGFAGSFMLLVSLAMTLYKFLFKRTTLQHQTTSVESVSAWYALPVKEMSSSSWMRVVGGVVLVTLLTPALSNYALFQIALGLTLTLTSIGPLYQLPLSYVMQRQKPTLRSCFGAVLAVGGVVVLAFRGTIPENDNS